MCRAECAELNMQVQEVQVQVGVAGACACACAGAHVHLVFMHTSAGHVQCAEVVQMY